MNFIRLNAMTVIERGDDNDWLRLYGSDKCPEEFRISPAEVDTIIHSVRQGTLASLHEMIDNARDNGYPQAVEALQQAVDMLESQWGVNA